MKLYYTTEPPEFSWWSYYATAESRVLIKQDAQLSHRDRAAGCVIVFAKSRRLELGDNILWTVYRSILGPLQRSRSFKVIEVGTNRQPVCDFLLVINSNWHPISYRFGVIVAYCSNFASTRSLWLQILRRRGRPSQIIFAPIVRPMNALQHCPWQFSHTCYGWGDTTENISKIGDFTPTRSLWSKISGTRGRPHQSFLHD